MTILTRLTVTLVLNLFRVHILLLELKLDGIDTVTSVESNTVRDQPRPHRRLKATELPSESSVEVKVNEGVVNVGAFGKERRKDEALWCHVPRVFVEDKQEGNNGVGSPGNDETHADAHKHLLNKKSKCVAKQFYTLMHTFHTYR